MSFVIEVVSSPDRDRLVVEIWWNSEMVGEIRCEGDKRHLIELYPNVSGTPWCFSVDELLNAIMQGKRRLG